MSGAERAPFADAGSAMRQAIERANASGLSAGEHRVFDAVLALLPSWSRLEDRVYVSQVAKLSGGLTERHTRACLVKLATLGIITWAPRRGHGVRSRIALPAPGETGTHVVPVSHGAVTKKPELSASRNRNSEPNKPEVQDFRYPRRSEENFRGECIEVEADASTSCDSHVDSGVVGECPDCGDEHRLVPHVATGELVCPACIFDRYREAS